MQNKMRKHFMLLTDLIQIIIFAFLILHFYVVNFAVSRFAFYTSSCSDSCYSDNIKTPNHAMQPLADTEGQEAVFPLMLKMICFSALIFRLPLSDLAEKCQM